jgi:hypothetical protein
LQKKGQVSLESQKWPNFIVTTYFTHKRKGEICPISHKKKRKETLNFLSEIIDTYYSHKREGKICETFITKKEEKLVENFPPQVTWLTQFHVKFPCKRKGYTCQISLTKFEHFVNFFAKK